MGEMMTLISAEWYLFLWEEDLLGGKVGGHNFIEPAALKKPCLTGQVILIFQILHSNLYKLEASRL